MRRTWKPAGPVPSRAQLHEAALRHLSRFATTEAGLVRVLDRCIDRWVRAAAAEGRLIDGDAAGARVEARAVAMSCVASGLVDDAAFAAARARRLARNGRSRRAVAAHLVAKGIESGLVQASLPDREQELGSALAFARRRRIGPFRDDPSTNTQMRDLGMLARAGFSREVAEQALQMPREKADAAVIALRRG